MSEKRDDTAADEDYGELQMLRQRLRDHEADLRVLTARLELQSDRERELRRLLVHAHERLVECEKRRFSEPVAVLRRELAVRIGALTRFHRCLRRGAR
jgi:hypothetical protein